MLASYSAALQIAAYLVTNDSRAPEAMNEQLIDLHCSGIGFFKDLEVWPSQLQVRHVDEPENTIKGKKLSSQHFQRNMALVQ